jgi:acyl-CoA thioesterase I
MRNPPTTARRNPSPLPSNYAELAEAHDAALLPFLLEPIAADRTAFLPDQLHPAAAAQPRLRDHVWTALEPLLD